MSVGEKMPAQINLESGATTPDREYPPGGPSPSVKLPYQPQASCFRPCIATMSLGHPVQHNLITKLTAASRVGFEGIELYWDDLSAFTAATFGEAGPDAVRGASDFVRLMCDELGLEVVSLQPFRDFDGLEEGKEKEERVTEFRVWLSCAARLGAPMIGVPASIAKERRDPERVVADIQRLADLAARNDPPVIIAYESLCFSAFNSTWQRAWDVVSRAGTCRDNVGFVLDTFNIAGGIWSDPCREGGLRPDRRVLLERCLTEMPEVISKERVALVQVADAELVGPVGDGHPLYEGTKKGRLKNWSRNCRLFPLEEELGAHMPTVDMLKAVTEKGGIGYEGWVSIEVFSRSTAAGEGCVEWHARRAWASWERLKGAMGWD